jgi:hypothetical protein
MMAHRRVCGISHAPVRSTPIPLPAKCGNDDGRAIERMESPWRLPLRTQLSWRWRLHKRPLKIKTNKTTKSRPNPPLG